ncbi:hypothetical protein GN244_ATG14128 [Phytophthora infestans]|uniref:Uncharacterized protein n=1 Tax=Phytophthora infestans TaxID=4787 RepID=A0A833VYE7_PHYIN|nr:hypothetical protein GN244_ATG14128 [Phytophthora infestans]KAF4144377.1 hypothetical protein GN958_ATG06471 [Phytophthora infestans]
MTVFHQRVIWLPRLSTISIIAGEDALLHGDLHTNGSPADFRIPTWLVAELAIRYEILTLL